MYTTGPSQLTPACEMVMQIVSRMGMIVPTHRESPMAEVEPMRATFTDSMVSGVQAPFALLSSRPQTMPLQMEPTCASVLKREMWRLSAAAFSSFVSYRSSITGAIAWPKARPSMDSAC